MALKFGTNTVNEVNFVDGDNTYEVKKIVKDGDTVWCKEYSFALTLMGGATASASISTTDEPTASTGDISNGDIIHYDDYLTISFLNGSTSTTETWWAYDGDLTLTLSNITRYFTGSYGFKLTNNNVPDCTIYWYAEYWNQSAPYGPYKRNPTSGWASGGVVSGSGGTKSVSGCIPTSTVQRKIYIKLGSTVAQKAQTTEETYSGTVIGLSSVTENEAVISHSTLKQKFVRGTVNGNVMARIRKLTSQSDITETGVTKSLESSTITYSPS